MVATFLALQDVDFESRDNHEKIKGTNFWYHLDRSYQANWTGFQVIKKFIRPDDPILAKLRSLTPGKKVNLEIISIGKSSVITDVKEI